LAYLKTHLPRREVPTGNFSLSRIPCSLCLDKTAHFSRGLKRLPAGSVRQVLFVAFGTAKSFMDKAEKILEKLRIYTGVKDVKLVVRPYKTRDAFTNLSSSPPTIYLNEYLIDDEEVVEYLLLRELIHIKLHMYPPMRYGTPSLSYTEKFHNILHFFMPEEKVEKIREKIWRKLFEKLRT
jgi:uncharacterized protein YlbG (UPF0298 family)